MLWKMGKTVKIYYQLTGNGLSLRWPGQRLVCSDQSVEEFCVCLMLLLALG